MRDSREELAHDLLAHDVALLAAHQQDGELELASRSLADLAGYGTPHWQER